MGSFGGTGIAVGSLTYDSADGPTAFNVRGLANNAVYSLTAWDFTLTSNDTVMPSTIFTNGLSGNTAEFCLGNCVFASPGVTNLIFRNDQNLLLQLTFGLADPTPFVRPPSDVTEWGTMQQSIYEVPCPICVPVTIFSGGQLSGSVSQLSAAVPEPSSLALLSLVLMGWIGWKFVGLWRARPTSP
jgi:hypothetical protein